MTVYNATMKFLRIAAYQPAIEKSDIDDFRRRPRPLPSPAMPSSARAWAGTVGGCRVRRNSLNDILSPIQFCVTRLTPYINQRAIKIEDIRQADC
jgi:hypothetical protein